MSQWLASIGPAVGDHLWQSTVFAMAAALLAVLLKKNQARTRYWIWLAALIKFLVPFSLLIALGGLLPRPQYAPVATPTAYAAMDTMSEPFAAEALPVTPIHVASSKKYTLPEALASVWLCGFVVALAMWCTRWRRVAEMVRGAAEPDTGRELEMLRWLERNAGMRPVRLLLSRSSMEPGMFGVVRPLLLWPEGISARLSEAQMEAILAHELCHVRRRDNLFAMAQMVVQTVFWFYPLVGWMGTRMVEEREQACDEEVLGHGHSAETYAASILKICEFCLESPLACVSGISGADLKRRIVQIMSRRFGKKLSFGKKAILATAGLVAIAGPVAFGGLSQVRALDKDDIARLPRFEVASVKPHSGPFTEMSVYPGGRVVLTGAAVRDLLMGALNVEPSQISDLPDWANARGNRFDIEAIPPDSAPSKTSTSRNFRLTDEQRRMLLALLIDRFQLRFHTVVKTGDVYSLVRGRSELRLQPPANTTKPPSFGFVPKDRSAGMAMAGKNISMSDFASHLAHYLYLKSAVVDKTGVKGSFDFQFSQVLQPCQGDSDCDEESNEIGYITRSLHEIGLDVKSGKGPVETIVIDHVEKPSPN